MQWPHLLHNPARRSEESMSTSSISIGDLEAKYPLYCKALKMLIKQGKTSAEIQKKTLLGSFVLVAPFLAEAIQIS